MPTGKITKRSVEAVMVPLAGKREHLWDDTLKGFGVMVTDKGVRSYLIQYRVGGRGNPTRRVTIGRHGSPWTAEKARARAADLLEQVRHKVDPFDAERERVKQDRERKAADEAASHMNAKLGFSTFADRFIDKYAKVAQPRTWRDTDSIVRRDLKPQLGDTPLPSIDPALIVDLLEKVQERGDAAAIKAYKALRALFGYAVDKHVLTTSPMANMKPPASIAKRSRALTDAELRLAWLASDDLGYPFGPLIQALILTGQRLREVAEMPWVEADLAAGRWLIPAERAKNSTPHLVPLATSAAELLKGLPRINTTGENGRPLFAFTTTGDTPVSGFSKTKARLDAAMLRLARKEAMEAGASDEEVKAIAIEPWRLHDLRRTLASGCQRLGIKLEVSEAILNHVSGTRSGIAGVYHVYRYEDEKRAALAAWDRQVKAIVAGVKAATKDGAQTPSMPEGAVEPEPPQRKRLLVQDATPEAMADILAGNPHGTMHLRDEIAGWLDSFERYSPGGRSFWLEAYGGRPFVVDRKSQGGKPITVPFNGVTVLGGIQPEKMRDALLGVADDGLVARFLWVWPDRLVRSGWAERALALGWSDHDVFGIGPTSTDEFEGLAVWLAGRTVVALTEWQARTSCDGIFYRDAFMRPNSPKADPVFLWQFGRAA